MLRPGWVQVRTQMACWGAGYSVAWSESVTVDSETYRQVVRSSRRTRELERVEQWGSLVPQSTFLVTDSQDEMVAANNDNGVGCDYLAYGDADRRQSSNKPRAVEEIASITNNNLAPLMPVR